MYIMSRHFLNADAILERCSTSRLCDYATGTWLATGVAALYLCYLLLPYLDLPVLQPHGLLWNALVFLTPAALVALLQKRQGFATDINSMLATQSASERHALKSEGLRKVFGFSSAQLAASPAVERTRRKSFFGGSSTPSDAPPGLGNWDNSCYQNSVLQGLSALQSLPPFLHKTALALSTQSAQLTSTSLQATVNDLNDSTNNGNRLWTPAKLKSMSSWQQQDAQEYYSKIMDDLDKESLRAGLARRANAGLVGVEHLEERNIEGERAVEYEDRDLGDQHNPLDGFLAQRVACTSCGFSEGLSMIPFNCLTVPLGRKSQYDIKDCLDDYTALEDISGVECSSCTLRRTEGQLSKMVETSLDAEESTVSKVAALPPELRTVIVARLQHVREALSDDDFSDSTINNKCQVPKSGRVASTKTRQAVIARAPQSLVIHINRSMFDEYTGALQKNLAAVTYPVLLDLSAWCIGGTVGQEDEVESWTMDAKESMLPRPRSNLTSNGGLYQLRAVVTHYGRHENGHYVCYRQHASPANKNDDKEFSKPCPPGWWRLSDDDVSAVDEERVLGQGDVFMLFYERMASAIPGPTLPNAPVKILDDVSAPLKISAIEPERDGVASETVVPGEDNDSPSGPAEPPKVAEPQQGSVEVVTSEVKEVDQQGTRGDAPQTPPKQNISPPMMRTSHGRGSRRKHGGFASGYRAVAAT